MSIYEDEGLRPLGLEGVSTYPLADRPSKVAAGDFARPVGEDFSLRDFLASLPNILAVQSLRQVAAQVRRARRLGKPVVWGLGEALGRALVALNPKHAELSLLCAAYEARVPFTAHVAVGTDIAHFHPLADGAALGAATHTDFRLLAELVRRLDGGGVYLNVGSAVILPEVFLKCVTLVRNLGHPLADFTTANFDFVQSYRPLTNVVRRPTSGGAGRGFHITGHHELTIPLLAAEILCGHDET